VSVGRGVQVGTKVELAEGTGVEVRVFVLVGVRLGVQVAQWVSVGRGVRLGARVLVEVCTGVDVKAGVSVEMSVLVQTGGFVCVSDGTFVAIHAGEGVGEAKIPRRTTIPVSIK
jgi:UDP-3-O-[3-hydroxymyristoyl] glucosamine N-acyltransferase